MIQVRFELLSSDGILGRGYKELDASYYRYEDWNPWYELIGAANVVIKFRQIHATQEERFL